MRKFEYVNAESVDEALDYLKAFNTKAQLFSGGIDLIDKLKKRVGDTEYLIDIKQIPDLSYIRHAEDGGLKIGALTTLSEIGSSRLVEEMYPALFEASRRIATPQIRNVSTISGNLLQEVRCWYLRTGFKCWKNGGKYCPAAVGNNRNYYSVMEGKMCIASHPSDMATALLSLDAKIKATRTDGERTLTIHELLPGNAVIDGLPRVHTLGHDEMLLEVQIPPPMLNTRSIFLKKSLRQSWDFALVSIAASMTLDGSAITDSRLVLGGVSTSPFRAVDAERELVGRSTLDEADLDIIAKRAIGEKVRPLKFNRYKVDMAKGLVKEGVRYLADACRIYAGQDGAIQIEN